MSGPVYIAYSYWRPCLGLRATGNLSRRSCSCRETFNLLIRLFQRPTSPRWSNSSGSTTRTCQKPWLHLPLHPDQRQNTRSSPIQPYTSAAGAMWLLRSSCPPSRSTNDSHLCPQLRSPSRPPTSRRRKIGSRRARCSRRRVSSIHMTKPLGKVQVLYVMQGSSCPHRTTSRTLWTARIQRRLEKSGSHRSRRGRKARQIPAPAISQLRSRKDSAGSCIAYQRTNPTLAEPVCVIIGNPSNRCRPLSRELGIDHPGSVRGPVEEKKSHCLHSPRHQSSATTLIKHQLPQLRPHLRQNQKYSSLCLSAASGLKAGVQRQRSFARSTT